MNGRIFDPEIGRFLSPDPVVQSPYYSQSWYCYSYVMGSPMSLNDPTGKKNRHWVRQFDWRLGRRSWSPIFSLIKQDVHKSPQSYLTNHK